MIEKYRSEVLRLYEQKKEAGELSPNLLNVTCANLRNETRLLFNIGCDPIDGQMLREFFAISFDGRISDQVIKKCDPDKFKPLCNFLKKGIKTHERNIEMLAWLTDFQPRPFSNYWRSATGKRSLSGLSISKTGIVEGKEVKPLYRQRENRSLKIQASGHPGLELVQIEKLSELEVKGLGPDHGNQRKEVTIEYPSGIKLSVDSSDIYLIAQLIRL